MKPASINTTHKRSPVCPHCGYVFQHPERANWPEDEGHYIEHDCPNCGETFLARRAIEMRYTTCLLGEAR